jgi:hypothetical protein
VGRRFVDAILLLNRVIGGGGESQKLTAGPSKPKGTQISPRDTIIITMTVDTIPPPPPLDPRCL